MGGGRWADAFGIGERPLFHHEHLEAFAFVQLWSEGPCDVGGKEYVLLRMVRRPRDGFDFLHVLGV